MVSFYTLSDCMVIPIINEKNVRASTKTSAGDWKLIRNINDVTNKLTA